MHDIQNFITLRPALNHRPALRSGLMATEAAHLLREFFAQKREPVL